MHSIQYGDFIHISLVISSYVGVLFIFIFLVRGCCCLLYFSILMIFFVFFFGGGILKPSVWHKTCSINWLSVLSHNELLIHQVTTIFFSLLYLVCRTTSSNSYAYKCAFVCSTEKMHQVQYLYIHVYRHL